MTNIGVAVTACQCVGSQAHEMPGGSLPSSRPKLSRPLNCTYVASKRAVTGASRGSALLFTSSCAVANRQSTTCSKCALGAQHVITELAVVPQHGSAGVQLPYITRMSVQLLRKPSQEAGSCEGVQTTVCNISFVAHIASISSTMAGDKPTPSKNA